MSIAQSLLGELQNEAATTRKLLALVPEAEADWKPHARSMSMGDLAVHLPNLLYWGISTIRDDAFDITPPGQPAWSPPRFESVAASLRSFDTYLAELEQVLAAASDEAMMRPWSLRSGQQVHFTMPKVAVWRTFVMNHMIHHRGQLSVYLRIKDIPLPSIYGPSADTKAM
jgi:uncharacterized damage-inducible protein DinB